MPIRALEARRPKTPYRFNGNALAKFGLNWLELQLSWVTPIVSKKKKLKKRRRDSR